MRRGRGEGGREREGGEEGGRAGGRKGTLKSYVTLYIMNTDQSCGM